MSDTTPCTPTDFWADDIAASQVRAPHADRDRTEPPTDDPRFEAAIESAERSIAALREAGLLIRPADLVPKVDDPGTSRSEVARATPAQVKAVEAFAERIDEISGAVLTTEHTGRVGADTVWLHQPPEIRSWLVTLASEIADAVVAAGGARAGNPLQGMPAARDAGHTVPTDDELANLADDEGEIWAEVRAERARAHAKHGEKSMESAPWTAERRMRILLEEIGEVAKEFNDADVEGREPDASCVRAELIQVAAMSGAWADAVPTGPKAIEHVRPAECGCLDRRPHAAHEWASLSHRWYCAGVTEETE